VAVPRPPGSTSKISNGGPPYYVTVRPFYPDGRPTLVQKADSIERYSALVRYIRFPLRHFRLCWQADQRVSRLGVPVE
jgi:hypothetical protein